MIERFITELRNAVGDVLRPRVNAPVVTYFPDDPAHLPMIVVGRPAGAPTGLTSVVFEETLDVTVLGRRVNDEDAQAELDGLADETLNALGGTVGRKILDGMTLLSVNSWRSGLVIVATKEIPAYVFTVARDVSTC